MRLPRRLDDRWRVVPFRARLTLGFAGAMVILFGGLALLLHTLVESSLDEQINRSLHTHAADLRTLVGGHARLPALPESDGTFVQVLDARTGALLAATPDHRKPLITAHELRAARRHALLFDDGGSSRLLLEPVATEPPGVLVVGSSLAQRNHTLTVLSELLFAGGPMLLILTCLAGYVLAERALAPVAQMSAQASRISGLSPGQRLSVPEARDELHHLGMTLNAMLARAEEALAREQSFVADAGHELRTPLAVIKLELEFALSSDISLPELQTRVRSVAEEVERLTKVAEDLLVIARADQGRLPLEPRPTPVQALLSAVASRFEQPAAAHARTVEAVASGELVVEADRAWVEQALGNLVSNALRHGEGTVTLRAQQRGDRAELHVLDQGPGFAPDFLRSAFERFVRADQARSGPGTGLGLSIVRAIAEAHGGGACAANRSDGGADVWVSLPVVPAPVGAGENVPEVVPT